MSVSGTSILEADELARPEPPAADPTDAELMARVKGGDRGAFAELVERHKDALTAYLARLAGSRDRAEDLAQEAFLRLYRTAGRYRERGQLTAFLYRIATNLQRSEERRARRRERLAAGAGGAGPLDPAAAGAPPDASERLLERERRERLAAAVAELPLRYRAPLVLAEIEGWPQREVARVLGCRQGTVKSRLFRARQRLRERLAPYWMGGRRP
jgi:RNA polymerase sigma-70 factor, ECF subfamily